MTSPVEYTEMTLRVTRGSKLTPMEKLIKPFDSATWICLIATIGVGLITITTLKLISLFMKTVFISISKAMLSTVQIFFGIGLIQTPERHSARILFTVITIFCLIVRTAYQGKMFDFLLYDEKQPAANSVQDVIDKQIPVRITYNIFDKSSDTKAVEIW